MEFVIHLIKRIFVVRRNERDFLIGKRIVKIKFGYIYFKYVFIDIQCWNFIKIVSIFYFFYELLLFTFHT